MENTAIAKILESQYKAALGMLRQSLEKVPDTQWNNHEYHNPIWQLAYHTIWGVWFYLSAGPENFTPLHKAIEGAESLGGAEEWENPVEGVQVKGYHTKGELIDYISHIEKNLAERIAALPLSNDSGFEWYPCTRFELHLNSIRHIQHHTAQIIERLKAKGIEGFPWQTGQHPSVVADS